ncbi:pyridoxamine 5'-phosphate oxidase family protein [Streptomyces sp. MST-110588]|nr:pyridoxamine 5'-phosphate oxidase family protein [Streptomyces sp. MST-110588]UNO44077.1 pyridoxamine 5'-phosphate oxidase family protein [Streptomyces sp. MST-110588]
MPSDERERFLAGLHVGVLGVPDTRGASPSAPASAPESTPASAPPSPPRSPLLVPIWYRYEPGGEVVVQTARESIKARLIRQAGRFSLCVQDERAPYRYVSVEGPVVQETDPADPAERTALALRYLPEDEARAYLQGTADQLVQDVTFRMRPERWRSADFASFAAALV